jgi:tRNA1Val (adenine37-N6)-methyltransferase
MSPSVFRFQQFAIHHDQCAFKVGTDSVLLGSWVAVGNTKKVLDIGTGSGLLSLMIAQRNATAHILAVEPHAASATQATLNFENSKWSNRLELVQQPIQAFREHEHFDLIISNPPYFNNSFKSTDSDKNTARHTDGLPFETLAGIVAAKVAREGRVAIILPKEEAQVFLGFSEKNLLHLIRCCEVSGGPKSNKKRWMMELSLKESPLQKSELSIRNEEGKYSHDYVELTKHFHLINAL